MLLKALRLLKPIVSVLVPPVILRVIERKSLKVASPSIVKSSTRQVLENLNLSVAKKVTPMSPTVLGRLTLPAIVYELGLVVFGCAVGGVGGQPVSRKLKFVPEN